MVTAAAAKPCLVLLTATLCALLCASTHARTLAEISSPTSNGDSYAASQSTAGQPPVIIPVVPAVPGNLSSSGEFVKQKVWESFPAHYHLATSQEAKSSETALHEVMPGWEIAYLADGTVGGALYGNGTTPYDASKTTLADKLGIQDWSVPDCPCENHEFLSLQHSPYSTQTTVVPDLVEVQVPGLDVVLNYSSPAEVCLQPTLDAATQGSLRNLAAVSQGQAQALEQLVALWNMDVMSEGMQGVTTLFTKGGYTISLKTIASQNELCQAINQPDQSSCACTTDYYLVDIEDASHTTYAAVVLPAGKPIGAGAFQRALLQSLEDQAVALVVPPSLDLTPIYRWVLVVQPADGTVRFGVI